MFGNVLTPTHLLIILLVILILFGRGKVSEFMGDFAKGIKSFKKGLSDDEDDKAARQKQAQLNNAPASPSASANGQSRASESAPQNARDSDSRH